MLDLLPEKDKAAFLEITAAVGFCLVEEGAGVGDGGEATDDETRELDRGDETEWEGEEGDVITGVEETWEGREEVEGVRGGEEEALGRIERCWRGDYWFSVCLQTRSR